MTYDQRRMIRELQVGSRKVGVYQYTNDRNTLLRLFGLVMGNERTVLSLVDALFLERTYRSAGLGKQSIFEGSRR